MEGNGIYKEIGEIHGNVEAIRKEQAVLALSLDKLGCAVDRQTAAIDRHSEHMANWNRVAENVAPISFVKSMFLMNCITTLVILTGVEGLKLISKYFIP